MLQYYLQLYMYCKPKRQLSTNTRASACLCKRLQVTLLTPTPSAGTPKRFNVMQQQDAALPAAKRCTHSSSTLFKGCRQFCCFTNPDHNHHLQSTKHSSTKHSTPAQCPGASAIDNSVTIVDNIVDYYQKTNINMYQKCCKRNRKHVTATPRSVKATARC